MNHRKVFVIVMIIAIIGGWGFVKEYDEKQVEFPQIIEYSDNSITEISYGKFFCQLTYNHVTRIEERQNTYIVTIEDDEKRAGVKSQNYIEIYRNDDYLQESIRDSLWSNDSDIYGIFQYSKGIASEKIDIYEIVKKSTNEDIFLVCYSDEAYLIKTDYVFCCSGILDCNNQDEYLVEKCVVTLVDDCGLNGEQLVIKGIFNKNTQTYQLGPNILGKEYFIQAEISMSEEEYINTIILQQDGELLQEINWKSNGMYEPLFGDFNGDNYVDIALNCMPGIRNEDYCLYLWDVKLEEFVKFQCETNLPYFERYKDGIRAWYNNTASSKTLVTYKWNGISLEKISEKEMSADNEK